MIVWETAFPDHRVVKPFPIEAEKVTEACVFIQGRRHARISGWKCYFESFEAAKEWLEAKCEEHLLHARAELQRCQALRGNAKGLVNHFTEFNQSEQSK